MGGMGQWVAWEGYLELALSFSQEQNHTSLHTVLGCLDVHNSNLSLTGCASGG